MHPLLIVMHFFSFIQFSSKLPYEVVSLFIFYKGVNQNGVISELFIENKSWDES